MADVFISYARSSEAKARAAAHALEAAGLDIWWDEQLPTHRAYYEVIEERLREARSVLVLWSEEAAKSQWVRAEADLARSMGKLVQASVDGSLPPMPFNQIQCAHLKDWKGAAGNSEWRKVLASIEVLTGPVTADAAPADAPPGGPKRGRPIWRHPVVLAAAGLVVAVALGVFVYEAVTPLGGAASSKTGSASIAVLPFETASGDAAGQAFAAALADDLGGMMSENALRTLSQEQARALNGADRMVRLRKLGATYALTGSARREDGLIKVRANLLDVGSNTVLWTEAFERKEADAAFLRDRVAYRSTSAATLALLSRNSGAFDPDPQTLALMIKGAVSPDLAASRRATEQVVARAPNFAAGHANYALQLSFQALTGPPAERQAVFAKAGREADAAIRLDPLQSESAYGARYLRSRTEGPTNLAPSEDILLDAQKVSPSFAFMMMARCQLLMEAGRIREAVSLCQQASAIQPLAPPITAELAEALFIDGQGDLARGMIDKLWRRNPPDFLARTFRLTFNLFGGDPSLVQAMLRDPEQLPQQLDSSSTAALQALLTAQRSHAAADIDKALQQIAAAVAARQLDPAVHVLAAAELGRPDTAFAALGTMTFTGAPVLPVMMMPQTEALRRDPRFWPWAQKAGWVAYWKARGVLPDFCSDPGVDCKAAMAKL